MTIEHVAIRTDRLETMREFYTKYFGGSFGGKYRNPSTGFESYFVAFGAGARLEIMQKPSIIPQPEPAEEHQGYAHLAFSVGGRELVDALSQKLDEDGYRVISRPRETGDGYYESCILDPDGNRVEITE